MLRRLALLSLLGLAACASPPGPSGRANPEMRAVLERFAASGARPLETLTPAEARAQPTPAAAAQQVAQARGAFPGLDQQGVAMRAIGIPAPGGTLRAMAFDPAPNSAGKPVILYFHGGGWVIASPEVYEASARGLARRTGAVVLSVAYRQAPEHRFPAAHEDALAAYTWLHANAAQIGGDSRRLAIAGESAGGNLALSTALSARQAGLPRPAGLLLVYPVAGTDPNSPAAREFADAKPLSSPALLWFLRNFTSNDPAALADPRLNLVARDDLAPLPPVTIVLAEIDPLRSGGEMLAQRLARQGVPVETRSFSGVTHEFFGMTGAVSAAESAQQFAADRLRAAFAAVPEEPVAAAPARRGARR